MPSVVQDIKNSKFMDELAIRRIFSELIGRPPWGVRLGEGSFLTMEFGKPEANQSGGLVHGEWHLWLYMCMWRIETKEKVLVGSEDDRTSIRSLLETVPFDATRVANITPPSLDLSLEFNSGVSLVTFSVTTRSDEQWMLFTPDGNVLTTYAGGAFHYGKANEPRYVPDV
jgi:hypothetical protein